jgi:hypothetical protein
VTATVKSPAIAHNRMFWKDTAPPSDISSL